MTKEVKDKIIHLFTLGYISSEIAKEVDYCDTYVAMVIREYLKERGLTLQEWYYQRRMDLIKVNTQCYEEGKRDGLKQVERILKDTIDTQLAEGLIKILNKYFK